MPLDMIALGNQADVSLDVSATDMKQNWPIKVSNVVFVGTKGCQRRPPDSHPMLALSVRPDASDYELLNLPDPKLKPTKASIVSDSGANLA